MLRNFFKVSIRNLIRNKTYSFINIMGLSIGMACSILIFLFIFDELSYDKHNKNHENIYRVGIDATISGTQVKAFLTGAPVGSTFVNEIPEVIKSTRVVKIQIRESEAFVKLDDKKFNEKGLFYVDSTFFDIFTVDFIKGNPDEVLTTPNTIVITETIAEKYFQNIDPVGKSLNIQDKEYLIQGVIKDCPSNSHFHYSILASMVSIPDANSQTWMSNDYSYTYLLLSKDADSKKVIEKMVEVGLRFIGPELKSIFGTSLEEFLKAGNTFTYMLQPITDIHLKSHTDFEIEPNSNIVYVYIFSIIALFILIIAIINFMNLSTARSATRAKEVGIRKVIGAFRRNLFYQFLFESVIMSIISLIIAMVIIESVLPVFNNFTLKNLSIGYFSNGLVLPSLVLLAITVGIVSGLYSASYLSSSKILNVIKGKVLSGKTQSWFRSFLVIFQFAISIALFICTFIIMSQLDLLRNKDIGFNKKDIIVIEKADKLGNSLQSFKDELKSNPLIESAAGSSTLPARMFIEGLPVMVEGDETNKSYAPRSMAVESEFCRTFNLNIKEGRFFSEDYSTDTFAVVLNESAVREFGLAEPVVGRRLITNYYGNVYYWEIIGVVKNFNFRSLHQDVGSLVITSHHVNGTNLVSVKFRSEITKENIKFVHEKWEKFVFDAPFDYSIMEENFDNMHNQEFRTGDVFMIFSFLAIFIACLGLFGLASFITEHKTKEIGIRKAMGASTFVVVKLLLKQFTKWVIWANIIAWPVAFWFMRNWLTNFAYRVDIQWWVFVVSAVIGLLIAIFTVGFQAIKAAQANPVKSLRYE